MKKPKTKRKPRAGILCPKCSGAMLLCFTRQREGYIYRRRQCADCGLKKSTAERISGDGDSEKYVGVPVVVANVHDFLVGMGIDPADLLKPVTIPPEANRS